MIQWWPRFELFFWISTDSNLLFFIRTTILIINIQVWILIYKFEYQIFKPFNFKMHFRFQIFLIFLLFLNLSFGHEGTELKPKATLPGQEPLNIWNRVEYLLQGLKEYRRYYIGKLCKGGLLMRSYRGIPNVIFLTRTNSKFKQ